MRGSSSWWSREYARHCARVMDERPASEGDSETNRNVVWWPTNCVKSSYQEFAIAGRLVTIRTRLTSRLRIEVVGGQRLPEAWLCVPQHLGLAAVERGYSLIDCVLLLGSKDVVLDYVSCAVSQRSPG